MDNKLITHIQLTISKVISKDNVYEEFIKIINDYYEKPCSTLQEIKETKNTKLKGDIFEHFCYLYGTHCLGLKMFFLKDISDNDLIKLGMKRNDLGIDLIGVDNNKYYAFQVKYRKPTKTRSIVGWKELSTFYALVLKLNKFEKHVVFTNANSIRHIGNKTKKDQTIAVGTLKNIKKEDWTKMANIKGHVLDESNKDKLSLDEIRKKRLEALEKVGKGIADN